MISHLKAYPCTLCIISKWWLLLHYNNTKKRNPPTHTHTHTTHWLVSWWNPEIHKHGCRYQGTTPSSSWHFFEQTSFCRILIYTFFSGHLKMWDEDALNPSAFRVLWLGGHCFGRQVCARPYPPAASHCGSCLWHLSFKARVLWPTVLRQPWVRKALSQGCRYFRDAIGTRQWITAISLLWARNLFLATW